MAANTGDLLRADALARDLRFALRGFRRAPGFFVTAVLILTVGIGTSVAMFTVFRAVLVQRLPVVDQDRIVVMWTYVSDPSTDHVTGTKDLAVVRRETRTMRDIAAVAHWPATSSPFAYGAGSVQLNRGMVTGNFFQVLGARPALGGLFTSADDETPGQSVVQAHRALVLSYRAWREKFGGDSAVIGRHLIEPLVRTDYRIVGVAPPGLQYPADVDYWIPMWVGWQSTVSAFAVARLAPGATVAAARDEYLAIERRLEPAAQLRGAHVATLTETILGNVRPVLVILTAAVGLLLLIACLNVGNLMLLRASARAHEIAVRRALGAGYGDIVRQLLVEAAAVAAIAGAAGWMLGAALLRLLVAAAPPELPRLDDLHLAGAPVGTAIALSALTVLASGLAPALLAARANLASPLRLDSRSGAESRRRRTLRQSLVAAQVALAMVMLGGAGLLTRSLERLEHQDTGFVSDHLSVLWYSWDAMRDDTEVKITPLGDRLVRRIRAIPGITAASEIVAPPMLGNGVWQWRFQREGQTDLEALANPSYATEFCGPEYFRVFGVPVVRGRPFREADGPGAPLVAIVSEAVARQLWPGEDPIGKRLRVPDATPESVIGGSEWRTVVGIARDTHLRTLRAPSPTVYMPAHQGFWQGSVAVRSRVALPSLLPALRTAGKDVDPALELWHPRTMDEILAEPLARPRLGAVLMSSFGAVALFLAAIGLFAVMAALVRDQTRELGIRIALGATPGRVRSEVLRRAIGVALVGGATGLLASLATSRLLSSLLFEVSPTDPVALAGACVVLLLAVIAAAYLPARRATRVDPVQALRAE